MKRLLTFLIILALISFLSEPIISQQRRTDPKPKRSIRHKLQSPECGELYGDNKRLPRFDVWLRGKYGILTTDDDTGYYNTREPRCNRNVLSTWLKRVRHDDTYALARYEIRCQSKQLRLTSEIEYDRSGRVTKDWRDFLNKRWEYVIPDSIGRVI